VEAIEKALAGMAEIGDYEGLADSQLTGLQKDYEATLAATIPQEEEEEVPEPGYEVCDSGSEEEQDWGDLQSAEVEPPQEQKPATAQQLSGDQVKRIKEAMQSLALPTPAWAAHLSDETFLTLISNKLRP